MLVDEDLVLAGSVDLKDQRCELDSSSRSAGYWWTTVYLLAYFMKAVNEGCRFISE